MHFEVGIDINLNVAPECFQKEVSWSSFFKNIVQHKDRNLDKIQSKIPNYIL